MLSAPRKIILIDGNAILHRGYHAYPYLTNSHGEAVSAVYGFFSMFLSLLRDLLPEAVVVCFDKSKPTIRQALYAGYHAHRPEMASDFAAQVPVVHKLLEVLKVPLFAIDGYEGDDLVGTVANLLKDSPETEVTIVTGDRDLLQLVTTQTKVLMPLTGITKTVLFDREAVKEKYGVWPEQFVDYKALIGDQSDGYPGVSGIGPKTAASLLKEYDNFDNLYAHLGELPEKTALKLATDAEQAALARKLATIITDVPLRFDLQTCLINCFDFKALRAEFVRHSFNSLLKKLDEMEHKQGAKQKAALEVQAKENQPSLF